MGLLVWIEASTASWVGALATQVQPIALIAVDVVINQLRFKPRGSGTPVAGQIVNQKTGQVLPHAIAGVARCIELAHAGIDEGVTCLP